MEWEEVRHCDFCGAVEFSLFLEGRDYLYYSPLVFKLTKCNQCGLIFVNPRPLHISVFYPPHPKEVLKGFFNFFGPNFACIVRKVRNRPGRVLDVGCGRGYFLRDMQNLGWEVFGNDLSETGCEFAKDKLGLKNIYNADLLDIDFPARHFDVVTMWHTLEHMKYPYKTLQKITFLLKDDGILIIETPNFSNFQFGFFREKCYSLDLPRHLFDFTPLVLEWMLREAGFIVFKKDAIVNPRTNFVSFRWSLLRWLLIYKIPKEEKGGSLPGADGRFGIRRCVWKAGSFIFSLFCALLTLILYTFKSDVSMRVYCRKVKIHG